MSPDSKTDVAYNDPSLAVLLPGMKISDGMYSKMTLSNIPAAANGWKVYCRYSNNYGYTDTSAATITIGTAPTPTPTPAPATGYAGNFHDSIAGRGFMDITASGDTYNVSVTWSSSASERAIWSFSGKIDANGVMTYSNALKITMAYNGSGLEKTTVVYNNGSGMLEYSAADNGYYWTSDVADDMLNRSLFVRNS